MTRFQFNVAMTTCGLSLVLVLLIIVFGQMNRSLEKTVLEQQAAINRGGMSQQIGRNLLTDMGQVGLRNTKMRELLSRNGYTINSNANANAADGGNR